LDCFILDIPQKEAVPTSETASFCMNDGKILGSGYKVSGVRQDGILPYISSIIVF